VTPVKPDIMPDNLIGKFQYVFGKFFSTDKEWTLRRNIIGAVMVYLPEIPAYFIPSYTQAKQTGNAKDLKHGEGIRGIITGGLEGIAVGAIVSKKEIKAKTIVPFAIFGAAIQFMSSLILPRIGEKVGTFVYNKRKYADKLSEIIDIPFSGDQTQPQLSTPNANPPQFKGRMPYSKPYSGNIKI
jgi:hypothetical protein